LTKAQFCILVALGVVLTITLSSLINTRVEASSRTYIFTKISDTEGTVTCARETKPHLRMLSDTTIAVNCFEDARPANAPGNGERR
jgi:hypothetical protein